MSVKDDGGSVFPTERVTDGDYKVLASGGPGMSLRDWFAGQALTGMCANVNVMAKAHETPERFGISAESTLSRCAYLLADTMLTVREKPEP